MQTRNKIFTFLLFTSTLLFGCSKDDNQSSDSNANSIVGVWVNYGNRDIITDTPSFHWRIFFEDGAALLTIPDGGFNNFIYNQSLENYLGQYQYANNQGTLKYGNNLQFTDAIVYKSSDVIDIQGEEYRKCKLVDGNLINATFSAYQPSDPLVNSLPYGENPKIIFNQNGSFNDAGLFYSFLSDNNTDITDNGPGSGTYQLKDFSLILNYQDGRVKQVSFTVPASENSNDTNLILIERGKFYKIP